jgi:hypothetical protein
MLYIYVLQLQNDKYYVGKTMNPHYRFDNHFTHNGTEWTKLNRPLKILELIPNCDDYDEEKYTYKYMDKYGIDNVRGGSYSSVILDKETIKQLQKISNSINNRCYICGKADGHFAKECADNTNVASATSAASQPVPQPVPQPITISQKDTYLSLQTLLTDSPDKMQCNIKDIDILGQLKIFRIRLGDNIVLNYKKTQYYSLHELIEDATNIFDICNIYNSEDAFLQMIGIPGITSLEQAKILCGFLLPCKIVFYKNIAGLLERLHPDRCKMLQAGRSFTDVKERFFLE